MGTAELMNFDSKKAREVKKDKWKEYLDKLHLDFIKDYIIKGRETINESNQELQASSCTTDDLMIYSIIGGIIGDVAGSSREGYGKNTEKVRKILTTNSHFTDDTTLMIAVADWLNHRKEKTLKDCLIEWYNRYPHAGFGGLFKVFTQTGIAQKSNGNGGAMRVAPVASYAKTLDEVLTLAEEQCKISHTTDGAINGAKAIAAAIFLARDGVNQGKSDKVIKSEIKSYIEEQFGYDLDRLFRIFKNARQTLEGKEQNTEKQVLFHLHM